MCKKLTLEEMKQIANSRGGKCLSDYYINGAIKIEWECENGHKWKANSTNVKKGSWCPKCLYNRKLTIKDAQKIAKERGGKCLSKKYINSFAKLLWECNEGHKWYATTSSVKYKSWCPICSSSLGERFCYTAFEQIFNKKFIKYKPDWLKNSRNNQMELDGYNDELKLAFEHQGEQHFLFNKYFHRTINDLSQRKQDDLQKQQLCKEHKIILIQVPEIPGTLQFINVKNFIIEEYKKQNIKLLENVENIEIDFNKAYLIPKTKEYLNELQEFVKKKNGECLSIVWLGNNTKLQFKCKENHVWQATPGNIKTGYWCPECAKLNKKHPLKLTIEEMQKLAEVYGGKCLFDKYINSKSKLKWECEKGHNWEAILSDVKYNKAWCPICARIRIQQSACKTYILYSPCGVKHIVTTGLEKFCKENNLSLVSLNRILMNKRFNNYKGWSIYRKEN